MSGRLTIVAPTAELVGGVQSWLDALVPGLEAAGWQVTVGLPHGRFSDAHRYLGAHPFHSSRIVENPTGSREGRVRALAALFAATAPDVVLAVNLADAPAAVARLRRRGRSGPRLAVGVHGLQAASFADLRRARPVLDAAICANRLSARLCTECAGLPAERTLYAPVGIELPPPLASTPASAPVRELLFVGRLSEEEKRILDLPEILRALDRRGARYRLRVVGSGPDEATLRERLRGCQGEVELVGTLDADELAARFYRPGSTLLVTSPSESGPLVAFEAMARGVLVVSSRFLGSGLEAALVDGETCLMFPVGDAEAAASQILALDEPRRRAELAAAARERVARRYSRHVSIAAWSSALASIARLPALPAPALDPPAPPAGRLDRWLGARLAETVRARLGRGFRHRSAGGEWPHAYGDPALEPAIRERARALDSGIRVETRVAGPNAAAEEP